MGVLHAVPPPAKASGPRLSPWEPKVGPFGRGHLYVGELYLRGDWCGSVSRVSGLHALRSQSSLSLSASSTPTR